MSKSNVLDIAWIIESQRPYTGSQAVKLNGECSDGLPVKVKECSKGLGRLSIRYMYYIRHR